MKQFHDKMTKEEMFSSVLKWKASPNHAKKYLKAVINVLNKLLECKNDDERVSLYNKLKILTSLPYCNDWQITALRCSAILNPSPELIKAKEAWNGYLKGLK